MTIHLRSKVIIISIWLVNSLAFSAESVNNPKAVEEVISGQRTVAHANWWGFDPNDATSFVQAAIDSGAKKVILDNMSNPWIVRPIRLASHQELFLEEGVVLQAKRNEYKGRGDSLLTASAVEGVSITGNNATLRMWRDDYDKAPYVKAEWRHAVSIRSCSDVKITGLTISESGGDGIYLGVSKKGVTNKNVVIKNVICERNYRQGISVISAEYLLIENVILRDTAGTPPAAAMLTTAAPHYGPATG